MKLSIGEDAQLLAAHLAPNVGAPLVAPTFMSALHDEPGGLRKPELITHGGHPPTMGRSSAAGTSSCRTPSFHAPSSSAGQPRSERRPASRHAASAAGFAIEWDTLASGLRDRPPRDVDGPCLRGRQGGQAHKTMFGRPGMHRQSTPLSSPRRNGMTCCKALLLHLRPAGGLRRRNQARPWRGRGRGVRESWPSWIAGSRSAAQGSLGSRRRRQGNYLPRLETW